MVTKVALVRQNTRLLRVYVGKASCNGTRSLLLRCCCQQPICPLLLAFRRTARCCCTAERLASPRVAVGDTGGAHNYRSSTSVGMAWHSMWHVFPAGYIQGDSWIYTPNTVRPQRDSETPVHAKQNMWDFCEAEQWKVTQGMAGYHPSLSGFCVRSRTLLLASKWRWEMIGNRGYRIQHNLSRKILVTAEKCGCLEEPQRDMHVRVTSRCYSYHDRNGFVLCASHIYCRPTLIARLPCRAPWLAAGESLRIAARLSLRTAPYSLRRNKRCIPMSDNVRNVLY